MPERHSSMKNVLKKNVRFVDWSCFFYWSLKAICEPLG